jgi:alpha-1,2-mannosyltransferase
MKDMGLPDRPAAALRHSRPVGLGRIVPDGPRRTLTLLVVGVLAWSGLAWIGARLAQSQAVGVGFDLRLLLDAGRKAAAGQPLYDQGMVSGQAVEAQSLFYSYPPFVAQLLAPIAGIPHPVVLVAWAAISTAALAWVAVRIARRFTAGDANPNATATATTLAVALPVVALAPFVLPYGIGLLFGNLNTIFPFLYGLLLLAAAGGSRNERVAGGVALGIAAATKLHPASLGLWFLVRGLRERRDGERPRSWEVVAVAAATVGALAGFSLLVGGTGPWSDYLAVVRAGTGADLVDPRNMGPAGQLGLFLALDAAIVRAIHLVIAVAAVAMTAWAAWRRPDPLESLAWAAVASLVTLPVTWYHYPAALIPFAVAVLARRPALGPWIVGAWAAAFLAIAFAPLLWVAMALLIVATAATARPRSRAGPPA